MPVDKLKDKSRHITGKGEVVICCCICGTTQDTLCRIGSKRIKPVKYMCTYCRFKRGVDNST